LPHCTCSSLLSRRRRKTPTACDKLNDKVLNTFDQVSDTRSLHISLADIQKFQLPSKMVKREAELSIVGAIIVLMLGPMGWIIDKAWSLIFDVLKAHVH
jgi:hypothetical protein